MARGLARLRFGNGVGPIAIRHRDVLVRVPPGGGRGKATTPLSCATGQPDDRFLECDRPTVRQELPGHACDAIKGQTLWFQGLSCFSRWSPDIGLCR